VVALKNQGMTVLYTTHYMEESQELSDHIAIMDHGRLIACGTNEELVKLVGQQTRLDLTVNVDPLPLSEIWRTIEGVRRVTVEEAQISVLVDDSNEVLPRLFEAATHHSARITSVDIREPNLEAVFLHLTGRALRD
jgi:ABC-2 type transport system ATP-binding protein